MRIGAIVQLMDMTTGTNREGARATHRMRDTETLVPVPLPRPLPSLFTIGVT